jgi:4a-hydroxytetrahydrobiopterin dehydratase
MNKLSEPEIQAALAQAPDWSELNGAIQRTFQFKDFAEAMRFVNQVADAAETDQHHPDILIRWNKVTLTLSTHDASGITAKDFALAKKIDGLAAAGMGGAVVVGAKGKKAKA